jgi:hypothetical protein
MSVARRHELIAPEHPHLSIVRQCEVISISRSGFYYTPAGESPFNLTLMCLIDEQFMKRHFTAPARWPGICGDAAIALDASGCAG